MDPARFTRIDETTWQIEPIGAMRVPGVIYADEDLIRAMDDKVYEQTANVATLPGIVKAALVMPDAHWGYGFPIGGVAAFDADEGGVISAGGVGFDVSCGVRTMLTGLTISDIKQVQKSLADSLYQQIPAGLGSKGSISLDPLEMDAMLRGGARWAIERAWGEARDLDRIEEGGQMTGAHPGHVSERAKERQRREMGTLGSGNHYLEVQAVAEIFDQKAAEGFGLKQDEVVVTIHCGSRGLGHQIGTEFLREMVTAAAEAGIALPDLPVPRSSRKSASAISAPCAPPSTARSPTARSSATTRAKSSRTSSLMPISLCSSTCRTTPARSRSTGLTARRELFVHRKGATRAFGPGHPDLPEALRKIGQPVLIGGSMGTGSYVLVGATESEEKSFASACHGAGRAMSRHAALRAWSGRGIVDELAERGILIRSPSMRGLAEEAPGAYKDVGAVVLAAEHAGLAQRVARLTPLVCIKG